MSRRRSKPMCPGHQVGGKRGKTKRKSPIDRPSCQCMATEFIPTEVSTIWSELRAKKQLCDGVVRTKDGGLFYVHRAILSVSSQYFKALFTNSLKQGNPETTEVTLDNISSKFLALLLDYAYTGSCKVTSSNVEQLLPVADQFQVLGVVKLCCDFLAKELRPDNCLGIHRFSKHYFCKSLEQSVRKYIRVHFAEIVSHSQEYKDLAAEELDNILRDDNLNARSEELVFEALMKWVKANLQTRVSILPSLLPCVRFGLMSYKYFTDVVWKNEIIMSSQDCQAALFEASVFLAELDSKEGGEADLNDPLARPRIPYEVLFSVGGWSAGSPTSFVETYDTRADRWFLSVNTDSTPRAYHGLVALGGLVYMIGGFDGNEHFNTVRCYDPVSKVWTERACMYTPRCYVSVCVLDEKIYALGGYDGRTRMNSVERYCPKLNQWEMLDPMHRQRSDASAAAHDGKVYVVGGFNGQEVLNSCELYDVAAKQWTFIHPLRNARSGVSLIRYRDCLYALGGFNGFTRLSSGEKYDPQRGGEWTDIPDMYSPRSNFATAVLDDMVFVIGGFNGSTTISYVECYDGDSNEWYDANNMNLNRSALSACVLKDLPNAIEYSYLSKAQDQGSRHQEGETKSSTSTSSTAASVS